MLTDLQREKRRRERREKERERESRERKKEREGDRKMVRREEWECYVQCIFTHLSTGSG